MLAYISGSYTHFNLSLGFDFSCGMYSRSSDINHRDSVFVASHDFFIRRTFRQRTLTPAAAIFSHKNSWAHSYIGSICILIASSFHFGVLFSVSISYSCAFEVKIFLLNFWNLHISLKHKHNSYVNLPLPKRIFERDFSSYVCAGVQFRHFREMTRRFLNIVYFIMREAL
jgi:hypothetical protein